MVKNYPYPCIFLLCNFQTPIRCPRRIPGSIAGLRRPSSHPVTPTHGTSRWTGASSTRRPATIDSCVRKSFIHRRWVGRGPFSFSGLGMGNFCFPTNNGNDKYLPPEAARKTIFQSIYYLTLFLPCVSPVVLLLWHNWGFNTALQLDLVHESHRGGLYWRRRNDDHTQSPGGFPSLHLELFPFGERAFKQRGKIQSSKGYIGGANGLLRSGESAQ